MKESKDGVTTAISNRGYHWPMARTTINLAPADVKKEGPSFDLPIALAMVAVQQERELPFAHEAHKNPALLLPRHFPWKKFARMATR